MDTSVDSHCDSGASHDALLRVVERVASLLTDTGLPRMPARVFAYVLAEDRDRYTARDLAEGLKVSPAAVSGAVRQLVRMGLLAKEREPGHRSDRYRVYDDDVWAAIMIQQGPVLQRYEDTVRECVAELGPSRGSDRLVETLEYMRFVRERLPETIDAWKARRRELEAG